MQRTSLLYFIFILFIFISCSKDAEETPKEVVDITAPTLDFTISGVDITSSAPLLVSDVLEISIEATDASGISIVAAFIDDEKVGEDTTAPFNITVDLSSYGNTSGKSSNDLNSTLKIVATDTKGNNKTVSKSITIITRELLLDINIPSGYLNSFLENIYVFASDMDGVYLENTTAEIIPSTRKIKIFAPENFDLNTEFMITFMTYNAAIGGEHSFSYATTFQNLTMENPKEINFKVPERMQPTENKYFSTSGFGDSIFADGNGIDYSTSLYNSDENWLCQTQQPTTDPDRTTDKLYLSYILNQDVADYNYLFIDKPLADDFQLDASSFENDDSATRDIDFSDYQQNPDISAYVSIYGYESENDVQKDNFHTLWSRGTGGELLPISFSFNTSFYQYRHRVKLENFYTSGLGLPLEFYTIPNWTIDPILQANKVTLNSTGEGHSIGRVQLRYDQDIDTYEWRILFDSQSVNAVVIPQIPDQFQNQPLFTLYDTNTFILNQVEISKFEGITNYENYLAEIVKENRNVETFTDKKETIFHAGFPFHFEFHDFIFDDVQK